MKCSSRHIFAPIDSTFCTPGMYVQLSGGPREAHDWSQPTLRGGPTPSRISVCAPSILTQERSQSALGGGPTPSSIPVCVPPWWQVFFSSQNPGVHGADLLSFSGALCLPLPPFEPHQVVVFVAVHYNNFGSLNKRRLIKWTPHTTKSTQLQGRQWERFRESQKIVCIEGNTSGKTEKIKGLKKYNNNNFTFFVTFPQGIENLKKERASRHNTV